MTLIRSMNGILQSYGIHEITGIFITMVHPVDEWNPVPLKSPTAGVLYNDFDSVDEWNPAVLGSIHI